MNRFIVTSLLSMMIGISTSSTNGANKISTHHYHKDASFLDTNPVFCGYLGSHLDLSRVTAVQDLIKSECGTCLKVTGNGKSVYVMAVDRGGIGLDLNMHSFKQLFDEETGRFDASWEATDAGNCIGIIKNDSYSLPGLRSIQPKSDDSNIKSKVKEPESDQIQNESSKKNESSSTTESPKETESFNNSESKNLECEGYEQRCLSDSKYLQCVYGKAFTFRCNFGTKCGQIGKFVFCN